MKWTTSKHVSMNRWTNFYNIFYMKNSVWIFLNSFFLLFYEEGGKLEMSRLAFQKSRKTSISKHFSKIVTITNNFEISIRNSFLITGRKAQKICSENDIFSEPLIWEISGNFIRKVENFPSYGQSLEKFTFQNLHLKKNTA